MIIAFNKKKPSKIKNIFYKNESVRWLYLGSNYFNRCCIERELGDKFKRIDISKLHDAVAEDIRKEHVQWIDILNMRYGEKIEWWLGAISSRNIYDSNLFQYSCYLEILERLFDQKNLPQLIVLESLGLAKAIRKWALKKGISHSFVYNNTARRAYLTKRVYFFLRWFKSMITLWTRWLAAYISRVKQASNVLKISSPVIISTFVHDNSLSDKGGFNDRYFPFLHDYLSQKGKNVIVYPILYGFNFNYLSIFKRMRQSDTLFLIQEDFLRFKDYFKTLTYPFFLLKQKIEATPFREFDLSDILREEQKTQPVNSSILALLTYRFFLRIGKKSALEPGLFITWYENQVSDKGLIAGVRKSFPKVKIIGAQIFIHPINHLNLFPCRSEFNAQMSPSLLLSTSQCQCKIAQSFDKSIPCKPAAALRYNHIFNEDDYGSWEIKRKNQTILVLLPFNIPEAVELLAMLNDVINQLEDQIKIIIKNHPDYLPGELREAFGEQKWPKRFEIFQGDLSEALKPASIVISSNSSSMVEAAIKGVPVIFVGRQTVLNQNILFNINMDIVTECFSSAELVEAINKYLDLLPVKKDEYKAMGMKLRERFFIAVTEETLAPFLN